MDGFVEVRRLEPPTLANNRLYFYICVLYIKMTHIYVQRDNGYEVLVDVNMDGNLNAISKDNKIQYSRIDISSPWFQEAGEEHAVGGRRIRQSKKRQGGSRLRRGATKRSGGSRKKRRGSRKKRGTK